MVIKDRVIKIVPHAPLVWALDRSHHLHAPGSLFAREVIQQGKLG
jgi:hypothetical protein